MVNKSPCWNLKNITALLDTVFHFVLRGYSNFWDCFFPIQPLKVIILWCGARNNVTNLKWGVHPQKRFYFASQHGSDEFLMTVGWSAQASLVLRLAKGLVSCTNNGHKGHLLIILEKLTAVTNHLNKYTTYATWHWTVKLSLPTHLVISGTQHKTYTVLGT
jgi:hypothetical protein